MSWLNNSLNTIKGQLTTLANEVLAETAGPGDEEYRGSQIDKTAVELLAEAQTKNVEFDKLCSQQESEIANLRKQVLELQTQKLSSATVDLAAGRKSKSLNDTKQPPKIKLAPQNEGVSIKR